MVEVPAPGPLLKHFNRDRFHQMMSQLSTFRADESIRIARTPGQTGSILPFVRGLRLSAQLIYTIRELLHGTDLQVHWGHLISEDGITCSPECDVIIHRPAPKVHWNGGEEPVMDFWFIECKYAVAVISCKSLVDSISADIKTYCTKINGYVAKLAFFAECCPPGSVETLQKTASDAGYEVFTYLYSFDEKTGFYQANEPGWDSFVDWLALLA